MSHVAAVKESQVTCSVLTVPMLLMNTWESERNGRQGRLMRDPRLRISVFLPASLVLDIKGLTEKTGDVFL